MNLQQLRAHEFDASVAAHRASQHGVVLALRPLGFREVFYDGMVFGSRTFKSADGGLGVVATVDSVDGKQWLHISMSRRSRMPTYEDMARVKRLFVGDDKPAYQVFPVRSEHVNLHEFCLHLWAPIDFDPFPDLNGDRARVVGP